MISKASKLMDFCPNTEVTIPDSFPAIYEDQTGQLIVYLGAILKNSSNMSLKHSLYWAKGTHSTDTAVQSRIAGFYKLNNGIIHKENFLDAETLFPYEVRQKNEYIVLPTTASNYYGICDCDTYEENAKDTRKAFGLTFEELDQVLDAYSHIFKLGNTYQRDPRITRSTQKDNCCDLCSTWIPQGFPYIAFEPKSGSFSHISLSSFYQHLKLLLFQKTRSVFWKRMLACGIEESLLDHIHSMTNYSLTPVYYREYSDCS